MKNVIVRVDVDTPTDSLLLNKLRFKKGYLRYLFKALDLSSEYGVKMSFMFRVPYTAPSDEIVQSIRDIDGEIALHSEGFSKDDIVREKRFLEARVGEIFGVSYHGCDLDDKILYKLTRNRRIIQVSGTPFHSLLAGFKYHADGYCEKQTYLRFGDKKIMVFPSHLNLDHASVDQVKEFLTQMPLPVLLFHPNYLERYGFRRPTLPSITEVFGHMRKMGYVTKTFKELYLELVESGDVEVI